MKWPSLQPWLRSRKIYSISKWPPGGWLVGTPIHSASKCNKTHTCTHTTFTIRIGQWCRCKTSEMNIWRAHIRGSSHSSSQSLLSHSADSDIWLEIVVIAAKFSDLILFLKALAHHPLACKCDSGSSGDDNDINGCPKTSPKKFPYFVPWASVGRAWH